MKTAMRLLPVVFLSLSVSAMAQITNSSHDLRAASTGPDPANVIAGLVEICLPCHTPHNSQNEANMDDPLWNHEMAPIAGFTHYTTLSGTVGTSTGSSRLCLGCHDGNTAMDNYGGVTTGLDTMTVVAANFGIDLSNDHPIGITYPSALTNYVTDPTGAGIRLPNDGTNDRVECQSCHDPHGGVTGTPFLRITNVDSELCLACHNL